MTELHSQIREIIETEDVALFMKGTPQFVMCGNSHRALEALRRAGAPVPSITRTCVSATTGVSIWTN